ncbi:hypothetical protein B0I35DRAFT_25779 [Stachybotrys elegans]|uniref:Uncharacterized protein n=1 Tax=Stachybotrys elegans TaxID=80388 RepID=A0A8K0WX08_9HYPO|nr:hypothetical protein B0I35DRAFT_25779 [Stachybotrys elegans]
MYSVGRQGIQHHQRTKHHYHIPQSPASPLFIDCPSTPPVVSPKHLVHIPIHGTGRSRGRTSTKKPRQKKGLPWGHPCFNMNWTPSIPVCPCRPDHSHGTQPLEFTVKKPIPSPGVVWSIRRPHWTRPPALSLRVLHLANPQTLACSTVRRRELVTLTRRGRSPSRSRPPAPNLTFTEACLGQGTLFQHIRISHTQFPKPCETRTLSLPSR